MTLQLTPPRALRSRASAKPTRNVRLRSTPRPSTAPWSRGGGRWWVDEEAAAASARAGRRLTDSDAAQVTP